MSTSSRRALEVVCLVGVIGCAVLMIRIGFIRSEFVGDTRCYPTLWQRNGRQICASSNHRRDVQMIALLMTCAVFGVGILRLHTRSRTHLPSSTTT